jgi:hypothetical protein
MADFIQDKLVICPVCWENVFDISQSGFLNKKYVLKCKNCGLSMETSINQTDFKVLSVGSNYQNAVPLLVGKSFKITNLKNHGLFVVADSSLEELSTGNGELFETLLNHKLEIGLILKKNEKVMLGLSGAGLKEERSTRVYTPATGVSLKVAKGVYYRLGAIGQSKYATELTLIDSGNFYLTTQRYIFQGGRQTIDQPLNKISSITPYTDGLSISRSNKKKNEFYVGENIHWPFVYSLLSGLITRING